MKHVPMLRRGIGSLNGEQDMKAALVALVVLGGLFVGYSAHAEVSIGDTSVTCDADNSVAVDDSNPTSPTVSGDAPGCTLPA